MEPENGAQSAVNGLVGIFHPEIPVNIARPLQQPEILDGWACEAAR